MASSTRDLKGVEDDLVEYFGQRMAAMGVDVEVTKVVLEPVDAATAHKPNLPV